MRTCTYCDDFTTQSVEIESYSARIPLEHVTIKVIDAERLSITKKHDQSVKSYSSR
jgi:hypothetical protein